jgi:hypothetical protein
LIFIENLAFRKEQKIILVPFSLEGKKRNKLSLFNFMLFIVIDFSKQI